MHDSTITSTDILPCTLSCLSCDYPYWLRLVCWYVHEANWSHTGGTCVSGTFSNGMCDKIIHFPHSYTAHLQKQMQGNRNPGKTWLMTPILTMIPTKPQTIAAMLKPKAILP